MLVTLLFQNEMFSIRLPEKVRGQYWIKDTEAGIKAEKIAEIVAGEQGWLIKSNKTFLLWDEAAKRECKELLLQKNAIYPVKKSGRNDEWGYILTEPFTEDRCRYTKYLVKKDVTLNIGFDEDNEISIDSTLVSAKHASLVWQNRTWLVYDLDSTNGIYVNNHKVSGGEALKCGDSVFILGCRIIVGNGFFAINNPDKRVKVSSSGIEEYKKAEVFETEEEAPEEDFYCRAPFFEKEAEPLCMKIEAPSMKEKQDNTPVILMLAPSLLMGLASFSSATITTVNMLQNGGNIVSSLPTLIMAVAMLFGMVLFPFIMKKRDKRIKRENEQKRCQQYLKYLDTVRCEIDKNIGMQEMLLHEKYPDIISQISSEEFWQGSLWSITKESDKFLKLRVGTGNYPMNAVFSYPENRFTIEEDSLREELERLRQEEKLLKNVPVCIDMMQYRVAGIAGSREQTREMLQNILLQVTALYGYNEVKLVFIGEERDLKQMSYLPFLPHVWDNEKKHRFVAVNYAEAGELSGEINRVLNRQAEEREPDCHYLIVCTSKSLEEKCSVIADVFRKIQETPFHFLAVYEQLKDLPGECECILQFEKNGCSMMKRYAKTGERLWITPDTILVEQVRKNMLKIAGYQMDLNRGRYELPQMLTFLQMFKVGKISHLNLQSRWKESNPVLSLRTPIGVDTTGSTFYLDMHEKAHGPHGLVAGMTGSGKSEFIITLILSLAVNYRPDEVAFILIDYKGGGLAGAFDNEKYRLPHLAGTITNLDGASITRSLVSIQSELRRRQAVFNTARAQVNEGTMDIYKYQKLYRDGIVTEPMPHLFIISDEFAELKTQQPEFMDQLISAARIGRSLGVHLILATQKPSGIVNEQIWANAKFKICLKVQDKADSNDMLKRPEAAEITETGRFYLQVGYNELFELGQSAWCGAPYVEAESSSHIQDRNIEVVNHLGQVIEKIKPIMNLPEKTGSTKQIVEILQYVSDMAKEEGIGNHDLWLPPLPEVIDSNLLAQKYHYDGDKGYCLNPVVAEMDNPFNQCQEILTVPFSEQGNVLVYGSAGSGKNTFITTMLYSLYSHHDGAELHTYILDFGAEALQCFAKAPQTGEVLINGDDEKIGTLFTYLRRELDERKRLLREYAGDYQAYCRQDSTPRANILVIINNYSNFVENYEVFDEDVTSLTRECSKYGIYFMITANAENAVRYKLQQNFLQCFVLQLNDKTEYFNVIGNTGGIYPSAIKGRGVFRRDSVYEFQTAYPFGDKDNLTNNMRRFCTNMAETYEGVWAKKIPVLSEFCTSDDIREGEFPIKRIPYALDVEHMETDYFDFEKCAVLQVVAREERNIAAYAQGMAEVLADKCHIRTVVFDVNNIFIPDANRGYELVREDIEKELDKIYDIVVVRHNTYKATEGKVPKDFDMSPIAIVIPEFGKMIEILSEDGQSKLKNLLLHINAGFGMISVVCDSEQAAGRYHVSGFRKEQCEGNGIYIGNDLGGQFVLKVQEKYRKRGQKQQIGKGSGYMIQRGVPKQVQLILTRLMKGQKADEDIG